MLDDEDAAGPSNAATRDPADDIALVLHASNTAERVRGAIEASAHYKEVRPEPVVVIVPVPASDITLCTA